MMNFGLQINLPTFIPKAPTKMYTSPCFLDMFKLEPSVSRSSEDFEQTIKSCLQRFSILRVPKKKGLILITMIIIYVIIMILIVITIL
jgi:hypothetical protein